MYLRIHLNNSKNLKKFKMNSLPKDIIYPLINELITKFKNKSISDSTRDENSITRIQTLKASSDTQDVLKALETILSDYDAVQLVISNNVIKFIKLI